jgi:hypothetical protein
MLAQMPPPLVGNEKHYVFPISPSKEPAVLPRNAPLRRDCRLAARRSNTSLPIHFPPAIEYVHSKIMGPLLQGRNIAAVHTYTLLHIQTNARGSLFRSCDDAADGAHIRLTRRNHGERGRDLCWNFLSGKMVGRADSISQTVRKAGCAQVRPRFRSAILMELRSSEAEEGSKHPERDPPHQSRTIQPELTHEGLRLPDLNSRDTCRKPPRHRDDEEPDTYRQPNQRWAGTHLLRKRQHHPQRYQIHRALSDVPPEILQTRSIRTIRKKRGANTPYKASD